MALVEGTVSAVRSVGEARALLLQLEKRECEVERELDELLEQQTQMDIKMAAFQQMLPNLRTVRSDCEGVQTAVSRASQLAESVSSKVRLLDLAKSQVYAVMKRVDDVMDLKSCVDGVQYSMSTGDYEKAAAHIHRYLTLDESILLETSADSAKGSSTVSSSFATLRRAEQELKAVVRRSFAEATQQGDSSTVERFFRIYPLLNLHEEGLLGLSSYLSQQVAASAEQQLHKASQSSDSRAGVVYADCLTQLYESLARSLEGHQAMVESYYGPAWLPFVINQLQEECDKQVGKILTQLQDERLLDHKVQTVSIALKSRSAVGAIRPEVLELDTLLTELSVCSSRTALYFRFLQRKAVSAEDCAEDTTPKATKVRRISDIAVDSKTSLLIQELVGKYTVIENYFMQESLNKAVSIDTCNPDGLTSSMADDIFFVLQKCVRRAFGSCNVDGACAMLNHASSLLQTDYREVLSARMKTTTGPGLDTLPGFSGMLQSKLQSSTSSSSSSSSSRTAATGGAESEGGSRSNTAVALNDVEVSIANVQKLCKELQVECVKLVSQIGEACKPKLDTCLADLGSAVAALKEMRHTGVTKVVEQQLLPRVKAAVEAFSSVNHVLSEDQIGDFEVNDPFVKQLISTTDSALVEIKRSFLQPVYDLLLTEVTSEMAFLLEQQVFNCNFNQLGGVQLDKDLRVLVGYLSSLTQWPIRDKFAKLVQMSTILGLDTVGELAEYWGSNSGPVVWRLTPSEVRKIMHLRSDFRSEDIARLRL